MDFCYKGGVLAATCRASIWLLRWSGLRYCQHTHKVFEVDFSHLIYLRRVYRRPTIFVESCVSFVPLLYSGYCVVLVLTVFVALRLAHSGVLSVIFDIR